MMEPWELFKRIHRRNGYKHIGKHLSYKIFKVRKDKTIYLCFQGSNGLSDWLHNFMAIPTSVANLIISLCEYVINLCCKGYAEPYSGCRWFFHKGFVRVWNSGSDTVIAQLKKSARMLPDYRIVICGFSHGGGLTLLAGEAWFRITGKPVECENFGSPKGAWGDAAVRVLQNALILTNWINRADAVTEVPLRQMGFRHPREDLVNVRRIPILSKLRISKHHQIYDRPEIYPENRRRAA